MLKIAMPNPGTLVYGTAIKTGRSSGTSLKGATVSSSVGSRIVDIEMKMSYLLFCHEVRKVPDHLSDDDSLVSSGVKGLERLNQNVW